MNIIRELLDIRRFFMKSKLSQDITFYSESAIYYQNYKGTIEAIINNSDLLILYITSDKRDPIWGLNNDRIIPFYIKHFIPLIFPFINTKTLIMTMTDLDQYHIKRSTNKVNHIYMFHSIVSAHVQYNKGAFDSYDTIFCVGPHHVKEIRKIEKIYNLKSKDLINVGYSWLEDIDKKFQNVSFNKENNNPKILIAPSWNDGNILDTCIDIILDKIIQLKYDVVVRPHPESIKRNNKKIKEIKLKYSRYNNFVLELNSESSKNIMEAFILITDWSGIAIEFELGMGKPVIYINTPKKIHNSDYKKIGIESFEDQIRNINGKSLELDDCIYIDREIKDRLNKKRIDNKTIIDFRNKHIFNWGDSSNVAANYIIDYCNNN